MCNMLCSINNLLVTVSLVCLDAANAAFIIVHQAGE
jgi:hypothetical protein